jgi:hypothetical protein
MALSISFRNWRTTAMAILANDIASAATTSPEMKLTNYNTRTHVSKAKGLNFNFKAKLSRRAAAWIS